MEPLFENKFTWSKKMLREMHYRVFRPWLIWIGVMIALLILVVVFLSVFTGTPLREFLSPPFFVLIAFYVIFLLLPLYQAAMTNKRLIQLYGSAPDVVVLFYDDHFIDQTKQTGAELNLQYSQIKRIMETESLLLLKLRSATFILVDKNGFTRGDAASLKEFLSKRTNAPADRRK